MVHRGGGDARHLVGWVQQPPDRRPATAGAAGDHHALLDRRPLQRRRALQGRAGAGSGHAALGHLHAAGERRAARSRDGGRGSLARPVAGPHRRIAAAGRDLAGAPAPRRLLEAGLGDRGPLGDHRRGLRRRRLAGRLHQCRPAPARGPQLPPQGADRAVGPRLAAERHAVARDRVPAGVPALVGPLAEGDRQRHHAGADAARLGAGLGATGDHASRAAGPVRQRRRLAAAGLGARPAHGRSRAAGRARAGGRVQDPGAPDLRAGRRCLVRRGRDGRRPRRPARRGRHVADVRLGAAGTRPARAGLPAGAADALVRPAAGAGLRAPLRGVPRRRLQAGHAADPEPLPP